MDKSEFNGWTVIRKLGEGGQGTVWLVRSPERSELKEKARQSIETVLRSAGAVIPSDRDPDFAHHLAVAVAEYSRSDSADELGALKKYNIPDGPDGDQARKRFLTEVKTLSEIRHPNLLRLLEASPAENWMITEFYKGETLQEQLPAFRGQLVKSLEYFRGLVEGVATLHNAKAVHRDIKLINIFVTQDRLVLGDFGIVFVEGGRETRVTETFERVGTRDWMPPWAHTGTRIDDVKPSFDVFCLGKVLWSMLSGRPMLPYWYFDRDQYNLVKLFPSLPGMKIVNERLLANCIVEFEEKCLKNASELLARVDEVLGALKTGRSAVGSGMQCQLCGLGVYELLWRKADTMRTLQLPMANIQGAAIINHLGQKNNQVTVRVHRCGNCGHIAMFQFPDGGALPAWRMPLED